MTMINFQYYWRDPKARRQVLTITSGSLILYALVAQYFLNVIPLANWLHIAAALLAGSDIAARAFTSLRSRYISIELLVTIAAGGALIIGEYWEASAVTFLFIFGAYLEARTLSRTRQVLQQLLDLAPSVAVVLRDGRQVEVSPGEVQPDEIVMLKPGAKIPVDGEVVDGQSAVDESTITGEPMPEDKSAGSLVFAGTVNQHGLLKVRATGIGADTTLARIIRRVEEAQDEKAPTQRFIERFARWYTPGIIAMSIVLFLITQDIHLALTLLVIGCPGALVISTPISVVAGIGRSAKAGILIKGGEYLENAGKISALAVDKTGTLTEGKPRLTDIIPLKPIEIRQPQLEVISTNGDAGWLGDPRDSHLNPDEDHLKIGEREVLYWAAIAEAGSEHPLARAIMAESDAQGIQPPSADTFQSTTGKGITTTFQNHSISVGTSVLMEELGVERHPDSRAHLDRLKSSGKTAVIVAVDGIEFGILGISDPIRSSAPLMVKQLLQNGLKKIVMLTGDDRRTAETIAKQAGISEVHAELLPEDKLNVIKQLQREGHVVAMIGDGINDAPALATADIGIAMGAAGTDIAIETADIALMSDDLLKVSEAIRLSKATLRNIHQNVFIALATVSFLLAGVLLGKVHMAGGMLVHQVSVLVVILNGMRLLRLK
jgi:Zn2+/Cd2+-exporting ATPase